LLQPASKKDVIEETEEKFGQKQRATKEEYMKYVVKYSVEGARQLAELRAARRELNAARRAIKAA